MTRNTFHKSERLCSLYLIDRLFEPGKSSSIAAFPLRMVYRIEEPRNFETQKPQNFETQKPRNFETQVLISVPKRQFKHAVDRNRVKRLVREAYRTHKELIKVPEGKQLYIAFIWLDNKHHPSNEVTAKVCNLLQRLSERINMSYKCSDNVL